MLEKNILITGCDGLVGKELVKLWPKAIHINHKMHDLTCENDVKYLFSKHTPKCIIHLAAKVGGIVDNMKNPASYFDENILMNTLLLKHSKLNNVERFIGILSSCIFPDVVKKYPMSEDCMHLGPPTKTNFSYGYAKRALAVQIDSYNAQYGTKYNYVIPCNLYGFNDKEDYQKSHFITALLCKIKSAISEGDTSIQLMGDGSPLRQFMHAKDLANILKLIVEKNVYDNLNIAPTNQNVSIDKMARIALKVLGAEHLKIIYDTTKPNGQYQKDICTKKLLEHFPNYKFISFEKGIADVYNQINTK